MGLCSMRGRAGFFMNDSAGDWARGYDGAAPTSTSLLQAALPTQQNFDCFIAFIIILWNKANLGIPIVNDKKKKTI